MLINEDVEFQAIPVRVVGAYADMEQRRRFGWVVQHDVVPTRTNRSLSDYWVGFVRVWRVCQTGTKFMGFLALNYIEHSRARQRYGGDWRKQIVVSNNHFERFYKHNGESVHYCNILFGRVQLTTNVENRQIYPEAGYTVLGSDLRNFMLAASEGN
jgi:hypothetical protein